MNKPILLDTHILLWWLEDHERLPKNLKLIIANPSRVIMVSVASVWEMVIKESLGKLSYPYGIEKTLKENQFQVLPIQIRHLEKLRSLPMIHRDPFDRLLIAQALTDNLVLATVDEKIKQYPVPTL